MIPNIGDLLKLWLLDEKSEWRHTNEIKWKSKSGTSGSATSELGFIVHPASQHLEEVLWVEQDKVSNPLWTNPLLIADPKFFEKLRVVLAELSDFFNEHPDRDSRDRDPGSAFMRLNLMTSWNWTISYD